jgi:hypothetical protein
MLACDLIVEVRAARSVSAEQAARLERSLPIGATISRETIDVLFTIDLYAERAAPAWTQLLARAVLSGVVLGEAPAGVLTEAKADWLIGMIGSDRIADLRSLELIARIMARSDSSPDWLQQLLVELSARNHRQGAPERGARRLQAALAESFPAPQNEPAPQTEHAAVSAEVVPLRPPLPAEMPVAAAA